MDRKRFLTETPVKQLILRLAFPTILSMLVTGIYNTADTFFVGKISTQATAAVGLVFSVMALIQALGFFCGHGSGNYLARMLDGGEDPLFIARRLCLSASEDVGLANPNALLLANACFQVVHQICMPEARIPLAETTVYLASSPKSNASYMAIEKALATVKEDRTKAVPLYLRNAPTKLMEDLGYSDGYKYAHDYPGHFVDLEFMPKGLEGTVFYEPAPNPHEDRLKAYLKACWPKYYV